MEGQSVFLLGFGGTGRTYAANMIIKELLEGGKHVCCTAYTRMASQNIGRAIRCFKQPPSRAPADAATSNIACDTRL